MVTHRIVLMTVSFLISWAPFSFAYLLPLLGIRETGPTKSTDVIPLMTAKIGSALINPLVYVFGNAEVRKM